MKSLRNSSERGQSAVLIALLFLAFTGILALVLDGGSAYAARRRAQNAADAGALAGATYMCEHMDEAGGVTTAINYAVLNGAVNPPTVYANLSENRVIVTATVETESFFVGAIGIPALAPQAEAEAQCRPPVGMGVMPVAWSCRERAGEYDPLPGEGCAQEFGPSNIYVLMDSVKVSKNNCNPDQLDPNHPQYCDYTQNDIVCDDPLNPTGDPLIDCDLDNDGINELMAGGARSWLDLDGGGGGASELSNWLINGFPNVIYPHTWIPEQAGVSTSIFKDAEVLVGREVVLPVFNKVCPNDSFTFTNPETSAQCNAGINDDISLAVNNMNFHVIDFSKFHVTCVQTNKNKAVEESPTGPQNVNGCPGHDLAVSVDSIDDNDKTIEGYFVEGQIYSYGGSGDWMDVGTFVVVLVR
jgi:hypothetical protein